MLSFVPFCFQEVFPNEFTSADGKPGELIFLQLSPVYLCITIYYTPNTKCGGGLYWIRFVASVGPSVSNLCPLYNSFTNGRISFKLEWHIHLN